MATSELKLDVRRKKILDLLYRDGQVRMSQLTKLLSASAVTIRSDLDALERDGYLERVQGGAVQTDKNRSNLQLLLRKQELREEKLYIAELCAELIPDGSTVLFNSGSTTYYVAQMLRKKKNLNIVTNSLAIAEELGGMQSFRVILLGGYINVQYSFTYGGDTQDQLRRYRADFAVLSTEGVDAKTGLTTMHAEEAVVDRQMIERAGTTIVVADHTKLCREGFSYVTELDSADILVTDSKADPAALEVIRNASIRIVNGK